MSESSNIKLNTSSRFGCREFIDQALSIYRVWACHDSEPTTPLSMPASLFSDDHLVVTSIATIHRPMPVCIEYGFFKVQYMILTLVVQFDTLVNLSEVLPYPSSSQFQLDFSLAVTSSPSQGYDTNKHTRVLEKAWYTIPQTFSRRDCD